MSIDIPRTPAGRAKVLEEMTWREVEDALTRTDVAILTPSAIEQHGAHLPLGTDWYIGQETTRCTIEALAERGHQAIGYAFPLGKSDGFLGFAGSLTLSNATFVAVQKEMAACLHQQGFRRFCLLSGNGGNGTTMTVAAEEIHRELGVPVVFVDPLPFQWSYRDDLLVNPKQDHHGAEGETAKMLASNGDLVHMERATAIPLPANLPRMATGVRKFAGRWEDFAPGGVVGDPMGATAENGREMYRRNAAWIADLLEKEFFSS